MPIRKGILQSVIWQCSNKGNALRECVLVKGSDAKHRGGHGFQCLLRYLLGSAVSLALGVVGGADPCDAGVRSFTAVVLPADAASYLAGEHRSRTGLYLNALCSSGKFLLYSVECRTVNNWLVRVLDVVHGKLAVIYSRLLRQVVGTEGLLQQHISNVFFIPQELIEADNYHALQLLEYLYPKQVDCIYIDPPYNTGARDWKYNNDYVDSSDSWRHSKWLSMMQKRLKIAKRILNPNNSVLIVTIDEKEYLHLGCLLEEMFPEARIQMVSSVINPAGVTRTGGFSRTDEYIYFVMLGNCSPQPLSLSKDWRGNIKGGYKDKLRWNGLQRSGTAIYRADRPNMFYPIYINTDGDKIVSVGQPISLETDRHTIPTPHGTVAVWPIFPDGREGRWRLGRESLIDLIPKHYVKLGKFRGESTSISYLAKGERVKVENGDFPIVGYSNDGSIIVDESEYQAKFVPGTQWWISSHDATQNGTKILTALLQSTRFSFPKSPYAVKDALSFFTHNKPNALIADFFAGSGTTLHAVNLLNAEDSGHRRCIMVTNNEVSADEAKSLTKDGYQPGDPEWENLGIARYVTWPRTVCSIEGHDINGVPLKGNYLVNDADGNPIPMSQGFKANCEYFKLGFLDKDDVALGRQFKGIFHCCG